MENLESTHTVLGDMENLDSDLKLAVWRPFHMTVLGGRGGLGQFLLEMELNSFTEWVV